MKIVRRERGRSYWTLGFILQSTYGFGDIPWPIHLTFMVFFPTISFPASCASCKAALKGFVLWKAQWKGLKNTRQYNKVSWGFLTKVKNIHRALKLILEEPKCKLYPETTWKPAGENQTRFMGLIISEMEVILVILSLWVLPEFSYVLSGSFPSARVTSEFTDPPAIPFHPPELLPGLQGQMTSLSSIWQLAALDLAISTWSLLVSSLRGWTRRLQSTFMMVTWTHAICREPKLSVWLQL